MTDPDFAIPRHVLIASGAFGLRLPARAVAAALSRGLCSEGSPAPDVLELEQPGARAAEAARLLAEHRFDERMLAARALVIALERLGEPPLAGSLLMEMATRARQSGVPAYAVARESSLGAFDARMLDLQLVLAASGPAGLERTGRELAAVA